MCTCMVMKIFMDCLLGEFLNYVTAVYTKKFLIIFLEHDIKVSMWSSYVNLISTAGRQGIELPPKCSDDSVPSTVCVHGGYVVLR